MKNKKLNLQESWSKAVKVVNACWKVSIIVIGVFALILISGVVFALYTDHYSRSAHYWDKKLSNDICIHRFSNNTVKVYDIKAGHYISPRLQWVANTHIKDTLVVFCDKKGKRGFIDAKTGRIVIAGKYEHAWNFSEGLAAVVEPDGKMGFIDTSGRYVIAPDFDYSVKNEYLFKHGVCCVEDIKGDMGLLAKDGTWAVPQEYTNIIYIKKADMFILEKNGKRGLIRNGNFEWICPMEYDDICWTNAPSGEGFILYKDFHSCRVTVDGKILDAFLVDETKELKYMTKYNVYDTDEYEISNQVIAFRVYQLWGVMDKHTGKVLVPAIYGNVDMVSPNIIQCSLEESEYDDNVLYDVKGNKLIR